MVPVTEVLLEGGDTQPNPIEFVSGGPGFVAVIRIRWTGCCPYTSAHPGWLGSPDDVLDLGVLLGSKGINVCLLNPRGLYDSEGVSTDASTLEDIGAA